MFKFWLVVTLKKVVLVMANLATNTQKERNVSTLVTFATPSTIITSLERYNITVIQFTFGLAVNPKCLCRALTKI